MFNFYFRSTQNRKFVFTRTNLVLLLVSNNIKENLPIIKVT